MTSIIPTELREQIRKRIWEQADALGWAKLNDRQRAEWYENWSKDKDVGGKISRFMDARRVRVYIKDALLKPYLRARGRDDWDTVARVLGVDPCILGDSVRFEKPHGARLADGRVISWGSSRDWKAILMAVFERSEAAEHCKAFGVVLIEAGKTLPQEKRSLIVKAGKLLGIQNISWME